MRYPVLNLPARRFGLGENPRVDELWVRYGFVAYPGDNAPHLIQWRNCKALVEALAPAYDPTTPQGLAAVDCMNQLLVTLGRGSEAVQIELPEPPPGTCTQAGVRMTPDQGGYAPMNCPTGPNCMSVIDANTGKVIIRDLIGNAEPNAVCSKWGFRYGEPPGGWPPSSTPGTGGAGTPGTGVPGGGVPGGGAPGGGIPGGLPGNTGGVGFPGGTWITPEGAGASPQGAASGSNVEIIPEKKAPDKSGLIGAGLGILAVVGAAIYGSQK